MEIRFRKMNTQEFDSYSEYSTNDYVKDLMKNSNMTQEEALLQAKNEFASMLPEGINTKDHSLMMIVQKVLFMCGNTIFPVSIYIGNVVMSHLEKWTTECI